MPKSKKRQKLGLFRQQRPSVSEKKTIFAVFWTMAFSVVANWQQSDKVEHGCTTTPLQTFPYPTANNL